MTNRIDIYYNKGKIFTIIKPQNEPLEEALKRIKENIIVVPVK